MAGRGNRPPVQVTPVEFIAWRNRIVEGKWFAALVGVRQPQGLFVPGLD